jgi:hypothetical protein
MVVVFIAHKQNLMSMKRGLHTESVVVVHPCTLNLSLKHITTVTTLSAIYLL